MVREREEERVGVVAICGTGVQRWQSARKEGREVKTARQHGGCNNGGLQACEGEEMETCKEQRMQEGCAGGSDSEDEGRQQLVRVAGEGGGAWGGDAEQRW